jgi:hypothetical protein
MVGFYYKRAEKEGGVVAFLCFCSLSLRERARVRVFLTFEWVFS